MAIEGAGAEHQAWTTPVSRVGRLGLQLNRAIDALDPQELARMTNAYHTASGDLSTRPGQTLLATGAGSFHSAVRVNAPTNNTAYRFFGADAILYAGLGGALTNIDSAYSGDPLTLLPHRPTLQGNAWMLVADKNKMRKVRPSDNLVLPLGLAAPAAPVTTLAAQLKTGIATFDVPDGTDAATWHGSAGVDRSTVPLPTGAGTTGDVAAPAPWLPGSAVQFFTAPGQAATGYYNVFGRGRNMDLSTFGGGVAASDNDIIHFWIKVSDPTLVEEVRIYLVCADTFYQDVVPGTDAAHNLDAFVKTVQQSDIAPFVDLLESGNTAAQRVAQTKAVQDVLTTNRNNELIDPSTGQVVDAPASADDSRATTLSPAAGRQWAEFGVVGAPVRRGDFQRLGNAVGRDWSTITGLIIVIQTTTKDPVSITLDDLYLTGGSGPDATEPGSLKYDYRVTNYDPRTGAESNGSVAQANADALTPLRQSVQVQPAAHADANIRQRAYRRGGSVVNDWYFVAQNAANGGLITDGLTDLTVFGTGITVPTHNFQPIPTIDANGNTVLNQPLRVIWGPVNGLILGCGDPYRPGELYWCSPGEPDHWSDVNHEEVCAPSEELMNGCVYGGQSYTFSREKLYVNYVDLQSNGQVKSTPTACINGMRVRWGLAVTDFGMAFVSRDGIRLTTGGPSDYLSDQIRSVFNNETKNGYLPVDWTDEGAVRLAYFNNDLWFFYKDTGGTRRIFIYNFLYKYWRAYTFQYQPRFAYWDPNHFSPLQLLLLGTNGKAYTHDGFSDDGTAITSSYRTGAWDGGQPREDKLYGDVILDADMMGANITVTTLLNNETIVNTAQTVTGPVGRQRYTFEPFGVTPQQARNVSLDVSWVAPLALRPYVAFHGVSTAPQPDLTYNRVTNWDDLGTATEKYVTGMLLECDTYGQDRQIIVEYDLNGLTFTAATIVVNHSGRHKQGFSWPVIKANLVRIRPADATCVPWTLWRHDWFSTAEPPRIALWDSNWENKWDSYYTGLDIECDTFGTDKTIQVYVDQVLIGTFTVNRFGRGVQHLTFGPGRGHVYRFVATDANRGLLYSSRWQTEEEPSEQANWNQNYTVADALTDKWLKGVLLQCDTFGVEKTVTVEVDGVVVETLPITSTGRTVQEIAFPQHKGRIFRLLPTDANPGRLYEMQWIFDQEPLSLTRFETQEVDFGFPTSVMPLYAHVTLRSTAQVTLTVTTYVSQVGDTRTDIYQIPSTAGAKVKAYLPFLSRRAFLTKYVFTSASPFALYREESQVIVLPHGGDQPEVRHPFGNDDLDASRGMGIATAKAAAPGGMAE